MNIFVFLAILNGKNYRKFYLLILAINKIDKMSFTARNINKMHNEVVRY